MMDHKPLIEIRSQSGTERMSENGYRLNAISRTIRMSSTRYHMNALSYHPEKLAVTLLALLLLIGTLFALIPRTEASGLSSSRATYTVGQGQTFTSIQDAIDHASNGDTILVGPGEYPEELVIDKQITLTGSGIDNCTVNWSGGNTIEVNAEGCTISNFHIIIGHTASENNGILITSDDNTVFDCNLTTVSSGFYKEQCGIRLVNADNNTIHDIYISAPDDEGHDNHCIIMEEDSDRNYLFDSMLTKCDVGVLIQERSDGNDIFNTYFTGIMRRCVQIRSSSHWTAVRNNTFMNGQPHGMNIGISVGQLSNETEITFNNMSDPNTGVYITDGADRTVISENNIIAGRCIAIHDTSSTAMYDNHLEANYLQRTVVDMDRSTNTTIVDNEFIGGGINILLEDNIQYWQGHTVEDNTLNGRAIVYLDSVPGPSIPDDLGQIILVNSSDTSISNRSFSNSTTASIILKGCNDITISNCTLNNTSGIYVKDSNICTIEKNDLGYGPNNLLLLYSVKNCTVAYNYIYDTWRGGLTLCDTHGSDIRRNEVVRIGGGSGIVIDLFSSYNEVHHNRAIFNTHSGISIGDMIGVDYQGETVNEDNFVGHKANHIYENNCSDNGQYGMYLSNVGYSRIEHNTMYWNKIGLSLKDSFNNSINNNSIEENELYGLTISYDYEFDITFYNNGAKGNTIVDNRFLYNNLNGSCQAYDGDGNNTWSLSDRGNYWSDWQTPDEDKDLIVDLPYSIKGHNGTFDMTPQVFSRPPLDNGSEEDALIIRSVSYEEVNGTVTIHIDAGAGSGEDTGNLTYSYFYDGRWNYAMVSDIELELSEGDHSIPIRVTDESGSSAETVIVVSVQGEAQNDPDGTSPMGTSWVVVLALLGLLLIVIIMAVFSVYRSRKRSDVQHHDDRTYIPEDGVIEYKGNVGGSSKLMPSGRASELKTLHAGYRIDKGHTRKLTARSSLNRSDQKGDVRFNNIKDEAQKFERPSAKESVHQVRDELKDRYISGEISEDVYEQAKDILRSHQ